MGHEYTLTFDDPEWYAKNRGRLLQTVRAWKSFVTEKEPGEIWLEANGAESADSWAYDVRLCFRERNVFIEVSLHTQVWHRDLRQLLSRLEEETRVSLVDDCDEEVKLTDSRADVLRHFPTLLSRWRGGDARLHRLSASHPTLTIHVSRANMPGFLSVGCVDPDFIRAPVRWPNADIEVGMFDGSGSSRFFLRDSSADVEILMAAVEIAEHGSARSEPD